MNIQRPRHHYIITRSYPSREVQRQERTGWRYWGLALGLTFAILMAIAWTDKAISQAAYDACQAYCEMELDE